MESNNALVIEAPSGRGEIYCKKHLVAAVMYSLKVTREGKPAADDEGLPNQLQVSGTVIVSQQERLQPDVVTTLSAGEPLTLFLNDGRKLDVVASAEDSFSGIYRIVPAGQKRFYK